MPRCGVEVRCLIIPFFCVQPRTEEQERAAEGRLLKRQEERKRKLADAGIEYDFEAVAYVSSPA